MNAETVWNVWRRILKEPHLSEALQRDDFVQLGIPDNVLPAEREVLLAYGAHRSAARWFVRGYRFRLTSSVSYALSACAPLTSRTLLRKGFNIRELGERFLFSIGWHDHGPYVYTTCRNFLDFLRVELKGEIAGLDDCIEVDAVSIDLVRSLADATADRWQDAAARQALVGDLSRWFYRQSGTGCIATTACALGSWLKASRTNPDARPEMVAENYLIYLPSASQYPKMSLASPEAKAVLEILAASHSLGELQSALNVDNQRIAEVLTQLIQLGVVRGDESPT